METFSALLAICAGNSLVPGEFPAQRPVKRSFDVSLIYVCINGWVNNREAGDLRRYSPHYDVTVMKVCCSSMTQCYPALLNLMWYKSQQHIHERRSFFCKFRYRMLWLLRTLNSCFCTDPIYTWYMDGEVLAGKRSYFNTWGGHWIWITWYHCRKHLYIVNLKIFRVQLNI